MSASKENEPPKVDHEAFSKDPIGYTTGFIQQLEAGGLTKTRTYVEARMNLGKVYQGQESFKRAEGEFREAYEAVKELPDEERDIDFENDIVTAVASTMAMRDAGKEAEKFYKEYCTVVLRRDGLVSIAYAKTLAGLAEVQFRCGDVVQAEKTLRSSIKIGKDVEGADGELFEDTRAALARVYNVQQRYQEAIDVIAEILAGGDWRAPTAPGVAGPPIMHYFQKALKLRTLNTFAISHLRLGKLDKAEELFQSIIDGLEEGNGTMNDEEYGLLLMNMGNTLMSKKKPEAALVWYKKARQKTKGMRNRQERGLYLRCTINMCNLCMQLGDEMRAFNYMQEVGEKAEPGSQEYAIAAGMLGLDMNY